MAWYGTGVAAVGVASSIFGGMAAQDAAEEAAKEQASLTFMRRQEEIRLKVAGNKQKKGLAKASVFASNLLMTGSSNRFVNAMDTNNMREIAFAQDAANKEKAAIEAGASGAGASLFANAGAQIGAIAGTLAGAAFAPKAPATLGGINASGHVAQQSPGLGGSGMTHSGFGSVKPTSTNAGAG